MARIDSIADRTSHREHVDTRPDADDLSYGVTAQPPRWNRTTSLALGVMLAALFLVFAIIALQPLLPDAMIAFVQEFVIGLLFAMGMIILGGLALSIRR